MSDGKSVPIHFWIVVVVSALWNAFGAYDYLMSVTVNEAYLANFPPELIEIMSRFPVWATSLWAIGVWFSVAGTILLILRNKLAATAFLVSLVGAGGSFAYQFSLGKPEMLDAGMYYGMPAIIVVAINAQWIYSRRMTAAGVLR